METSSREGFGTMLDGAQPLGVDLFEQAFRFICQFNRLFSFFKRELPVLIAGDPQLKGRFHIAHQETLGLICTLVDATIDAGFLRPLPG